MAVSLFAGGVVVGSQTEGQATTAGEISTLAGTPKEGSALSIAQEPVGLAAHDGDLFLADGSNSLVRKMTLQDGQETIAAGNGGQGFSGDGGQANRAMVIPAGVATHSDGSLFISSGPRVRKVDVNGVITTYVGNGDQGFGGDGGPATSAQLLFPAGLDVDASGNLYIADSTTVRKVATNGVISRVAGTGAQGFTGDGGPATSAMLNHVEDVVVDDEGSIYIADASNNRIRKVDSGGTITTVAGNGAATYFGDGGPAAASSLNFPSGLELDHEGSLLIADSFNNRIRKVSGGVITTVAGEGTGGFFGDGGPAIEAWLFRPRDVIESSDGVLQIADQRNFRIREVAASGTITTVAGTGEASSSGDGGPASAAQIGFAFATAADGLGNTYIADPHSFRIRKVDSEGTISTVAGNGTWWEALGDGGPANGATLNTPFAVAVDVGNNSLYVADSFHYRIRRVDLSDGTISTYAGIGIDGFTGDGGPAELATIGPVFGLAVDSLGNLFLSETYHNKVRRVDHETGEITTVAGNGTAGFGGDEGIAQAAQLSFPNGLAVDRMGNLFIADTGNNRVRRVDAETGTITTAAGSGSSFGIIGDGGPATEAELATPQGVSLDGASNLYIADSFHHRARRVDVASGLISTVAGSGVEGFDGDGGPALSAKLNWLTGVTVDPRDQSLIISDFENHRIRKVRSAAEPAPEGSCPGPVSGPVAGQQILPAGNTSSGYTTFLLLDNPGTQAVKANITLLLPDGPKCPSSVQSFQVPPGYRKTIDVNGLAAGSHAIGAKVESFGGRLFAEMSVHHSGSLANFDMAGADAASRNWTIPEGATHSGFQTLVRIVNPDILNPTSVDIRFLRPSGPMLGPQDVDMPPGSSLVVDIGATCHCADDVSTQVTVNQDDPPVVAGLVISKVGKDAGMGASLGVRGTQKMWVVAEGATHSGWHTFVLVANPTSEPSRVDVTFLTGSAGARNGPQDLLVPAGQRRTIDVNLECFCTDDVSTMVSADLGSVTVESSIQKEDEFGFVIADSVASGGPDLAGASAAKWVVAEGAAHDGFETFILIANPDPTNSSQVRVEFQTPGGSQSPSELMNRTILPGSRITIPLSPYVFGQDASSSVRVLSGSNVVVEMSIDRLSSGGFSKGRSLASPVPVDES